MAEKSLVQREARPFFLQIYSLRGLPQPREWGLQFRAAALAALALGIVTLVALLYLVQASQTATATYDIRQMESKLAQLERENALLSYQVAELARPGNILDKALAMGLTTTLVVDYIPAAPSRTKLQPPAVATTQKLAAPSTRIRGEPVAPELWRAQSQWRGRTLGFLGWFQRRYFSGTEALAKGP